MMTSRETTQTKWTYQSSLPTVTQNSETSVSAAKSLADGKCSNATTATEQGLIELAKTLADQVNLSRLPPPEPNIFAGDPIQYPAWKAAFNTLIGQRKIPPGEKLYYLKRYLGGSVRQVVENYFLLSIDDAYDNAKALLEERYGDPFIVANAFRSKLDSWPKINVKDSEALLWFSDFLKQCMSAMQTITGLNILNDSQENRKMLSKLPDWLVSRWNRQVAQRKEQKSEFPTFKDFVEFIGKEAKIACDPVTSPQSLKCISTVDVGKPHRMHQDGRRLHGGHALLSDASENSSPSSSNTSDTKGKSTCVLCKGKHFLDTCRAFLSKSLSDRKQFLKE